MPADFSRTTFNPRNGYRAMLLMQGRVLLDADLNEQGDLTAHHDEIRSRDTVGRVGGPLPEDPADPGPFAIVDESGTPPVAGVHPTGIGWERLRITPGRYYVDGAAVESFPPAEIDSEAAEELTRQLETAWPLLLQPFGSTPAPPGTAGSRVVLYLEVTDHLVTADEAPKLLESALGGPDTAVRRQTGWQVRWRALEGERCPDLGPAFFDREPRRMIARVTTEPAAADPCTITASGGYRRLENQLYRVQVHEQDAVGTGGSFLWSRENGSVVARALDLTVLPVAGTARLALDREGRDPELSMDINDLVELTGPDRQRQHRPGFLATVIARAGLDLEVRWSGAVPADLREVGERPIVRRWEGGPLPMRTGTTDLEDGIAVRFPAGGEARTGDHWQIPARAVQLAYGLTSAAGTIEWPPPGTVGDAAPPLGPVTRCAPLGILAAAADGWVLEHDCRSLFPPLTSMTAVDLIGGDGQESLPETWLDEPVLVAVRRGDIPVAGARLQAAASDSGRLSTGEPGAAGVPPDEGPAVVVVTGPDGVGRVRWRLDPEGPVTQVLTLQRIDEYDVGRDVAVRVTARRSLASQVAFSREDCEVFAGVETVAEALNGLAGHPELRLHGGDGQQVEPESPVLPQPLRLIVDSSCGPVEGDTVVARATEGGHVRAAIVGEDRPESLDADPATAEAVSGTDGSVLFWWQPAKAAGGGASDTLTVSRARDKTRVPIVATAQYERFGGGGGPVADGAHLEGIRLGARGEFPNDESYSPGEFIEGVILTLDEEVAEEFGGEPRGKPVLRVELDLPWPFEAERSPWGPVPVGTRTVVLDGRVAVNGNELSWTPSQQTWEWMADDGPLWWFADSAEGKVLVDRGLLGRVVLEGWAVRTTRNRAVNTHTEMELEPGSAGMRLEHRFPSDDLVAGGTFTQWFYLRPGQLERRSVPDLRGLSVAEARKRASDSGFLNVTVSSGGLFIGRVTAQQPEAGTRVSPGTPLEIRLGLLG
ncbi:DUF6519 domain-containing protein [Microbacterium sp. A93]|uniref:DUF6519 domain-containing protein n=1 Tax=Microbacterium sp. A93 TaxID=3450716 RepID=UPI003F43670D